MSRSTFSESALMIGAVNINMRYLKILRNSKLDKIYENQEPILAVQEKSQGMIETAQDENKGVIKPIK